MPAAASAPGLADPVFVLCHGRSGSTLLRFILDAHPELACPPETNLPALCAQLATVWSLIEGAPLSATRGDEPPAIPDAAIAGVRNTMTEMVSSYLERRGKRLYCDKSLGTARYAQLLPRVYPDARFICTYRHPMDVIASGMEACPWGLGGYGFDPYIAATPGNAVVALASYWADMVRMNLAAEEQLGDKCLRLRYEDLVADPEATAAGLFEFLGVAPAPGITQKCFSPDRERSGPADYKIWHTTEINSDSVGRGWTVPAGMIAPHVLDAINEMCAKLGYHPVDGDWGTSEPPADLRVSAEVPGAETDAAKGAKTVAQTAAGHAGESARLGQRLRLGLAAARAGATGERWGQHSSESFVAVAVPSKPGPAEYWLVDLGQATVSRVGKEAQKDSEWDVIGTMDVWEKLMDHEVNLSVAMRRCELRYCDNGEIDLVAADSRIGIVGELLGLASWASPRP